MFQPLEQFNIYLLHELSLAGISLSLTNYWLVGLYLLIAVAVFVV
jgi:hypothetical protein